MRNMSAAMMMMMSGKGVPTSASSSSSSLSIDPTKYYCVRHSMWVGGGCVGPPTWTGQYCALGVAIQLGVCVEAVPGLFEKDLYIVNGPYDTLEECFIGCSGAPSSSSSSSASSSSSSSSSDSSSSSSSDSSSSSSSNSSSSSSSDSSSSSSSSSDSSSSSSLAGPSYEDFTGYVELDPGADITVAANKLTVSTLQDNRNAWVYASKGVGHFGATFTHDITVKPIAYTGTCMLDVWAVSNTLDQPQNWEVNGDQAIQLFVYFSSAPTWGFECCEGYSDSSTETYAYGTTYYPRIERVSETSIQVTIYSDAAHTVVIEVLGPLAVTNGRRFRYIFPLNNWLGGTTVDESCEISNLDLHEAP